MVQGVSAGNLGNAGNLGGSGKGGNPNCFNTASIELPPPCGGFLVLRQTRPQYAADNQSSCPQ